MVEEKTRSRNRSDSPRRVTAYFHPLTFDGKRTLVRIRTLATPRRDSVFVQIREKTGQKYAIANGVTEPEWQFSEPEWGFSEAGLNLFSERFERLVPFPQLPIERFGLSRVSGQKNHDIRRDGRTLVFHLAISGPRER